MTPEEKIREISCISVEMAPAFVFKYDYTIPEDFDGLANLAYKAAEAIVNKREAMVIMASKEGKK